jgi:Protein of unknown function (DUF3567)
MQMLYNSNNFVVVHFEDAVASEPQPESPMTATMAATPMAWLSRGGFEIVDKQARKDIFIEGALAERFQRGVQDLVAQSPGGATLEALDDYIAGFTGLAQHPLVMH